MSAAQAQCSGTTCTVNNSSDLVTAITTIDNDPTHSYVINIGSSITLTNSAADTLPAINTTSSVTINGGTNVLDGGSAQRGFFVYSGNVTINNLTIQNTLAAGGNGGAGIQIGAILGGGGGLGAGGAIFVAAGGNVTVNNVALLTSQANGGNAGGLGGGGGSGGGLGGNGAAGNGGGGGIGLGADGGAGSNSGVTSTNPGNGIIIGAGPGGGSTNTGVTTPGGSNGGGGGGGDGSNGGGGGGVNGGTGSPTVSGAGGFGGGGGGGFSKNANGAPAGSGAGGYGGGGSGSLNGGGVGGFGGGGGGGGGPGGAGLATGGFGGGGGDANTGPGGGAGLGGAIFVQAGGSLSVTGTFTVNGNTVTGGSGGFQSGSAFGSGIFFQATNNVTTTLGFGAGNQTINDVIGDYLGNGGTNPSGGADAADQGGGLTLAKSGGGTLTLGGINTYSGGTALSGGTAGSPTTVSISNGSALGSGTLNLGQLASDNTTLVLNGNGLAVNNPVTVTGDPTIVVATGNTNTMSNTISGTGDIVSDGGGTLVLSGNNTYSGGTTICGTARDTSCTTANASPTTATTLQVGVDTVGTPGSITSSAIGTGTLTFDGGILQNAFSQFFTVANNAQITGNGGTIDANAGFFTYSGNIADAAGAHGNLTITDSSGFGTVVLSGTNTYSGGTLVTNGVTLQATNSNSVGTGAVTLDQGTFQAGANNLTFTNKFILNANGFFGIVDNNGYNLTLSGPIVDGTPAGGALLLRDSTLSFTSVTTLSGTNTYTGGTYVQATVAQVNNNSALGTGTVVLDSSELVAGGNVTIANNIALTDNFFGFGNAFSSNGNTFTLSGTIADADPLNPFPVQINGSLSGPGGTVIFTGNNTYTGVTTICSCATLQLGNGGTTGSIVGDVSNGGTLIFDRSDTYTFNGAISNDGPDHGQVIQAGTGTTILTATNTYRGATTINAGTLEVDGGIGDSSLTSVNNGGTLSGIGIVANTQINSGGTLAPGNIATPNGTLNILGNLKFVSGSFYLVTLPAGGGNSQTFITGTATLGGNGTVELKTQPGTAYGGDYVILSSNHVVSGHFAGLDPNGFAGTATLDYTNNHEVQLDLSGIGIFSTPPGLNQNQQNVLNGINTAIVDGFPLPPQFQNLDNLSNASLLGVLSQLSGEAATGANTSTTQLMNAFFNLLADLPFGGGGGGGGGLSSGFASEDQASFPPDVALAYNTVLKKPPPQNFDQRWSSWGSGYGGYGTLNGSAATGASNVTATAYGFAAGMDYRALPDLKLGFALAGGGTNWNLAQGLGGGRSDSFQAAVYGTEHWGPAYVSAALIFANHWFTTNRNAFGDQLTARFDGQSYGGRLEGGYRYAVMPTVGVTPYAAVQTQWFHTPSYSETDLTGGGFALTYNSMTANDTRGELGLRFDDITMVEAMPLVLRARVAWAHDWIQNPALGAVFQALPGSNFTVNGAAAPQNSALATASAELHLTANWSLQGKFDGEFADGSQTYGGSGTLRYVW